VYKGAKAREKTENIQLQNENSGKEKAVVWQSTATAIFAYVIKRVHFAMTTGRVYFTLSHYTISGVFQINKRV